MTTFFELVLFWQLLRGPALPLTGCWWKSQLMQITRNKKKIGSNPQNMSHHLNPAVVYGQAFQGLILSELPEIENINLWYFWVGSSCVACLLPESQRAHVHTCWGAPLLHAKYRAECFLMNCVLMPHYCVHYCCAHTTLCHLWVESV